MRLIWCIKKGKNRGFRNDLVACVACHCRQRNQCIPYTELPMEQIITANIEAKKKGYQVVEDFPLFEAVQGMDNNT